MPRSLMITESTLHRNNIRYDYFSGCSGVDKNKTLKG